MNHFYTELPVIKITQIPLKLIKNAAAFKIRKFCSTAFTKLPGEIATTNLVDSFGRKHNYLRISLTERCSLRCRYCMPEDGIQLSDNRKLLSAKETQFLAELFVKSFAVDKIRLTGGEPLVRKDIIEVVEGLSRLKENGLKTIGMTTNGLVFGRMCSQLKKAGLNAVNISLDTLIPAKFELITRRRGWKNVMSAIEKAVEENFDCLVKVNCVVMKGFNDDEVCEFVELTRNRPLDVRFIEYMPFDGNKWNVEKMITFKEMLDKIKEKFAGVEQCEPKPNDTAKPYKVAGFKGQFGFISSMSQNFCGTCNRLRITADGNLKVCLFDQKEVSLRDAIRESKNYQELDEIIRSALYKKKKQHGGAFKIASTANRPMILIDKRSFCTQSFLTHIDNETGKPKMVDVSDKKVTRRTAVASGRVWVGRQVCDLIANNQIKKGNVLTVAELAGVMATKWTSQLIPLCHQIPMDNSSLRAEVDHLNEEVVITASVKSESKTGVEMEALTGVSVAALTVLDMCKAVNKKIVIKEIKLISKSGGKSEFVAEK